MRRANVVSLNCSLVGGQRSVRIRPPIAIELPDATHLLDHVEVHLGDDEFILSSTQWPGNCRVGRRNDGSVESSDVPGASVPTRLLQAMKYPLLNCVSWLFELPEAAITRQRRRWVEHDFGAVQAEEPCAFRKVTVVADAHQIVATCGLEYRIPEASGLKNTFPESRRMRM